MADTYTITVDGAPMFYTSTLSNAGTVHDKIKQRVPGVAVELVMPDGSTLTNPTFPEALEFLARKGYTVLDKSGKAPEVEPEKPVRKVAAARTTRTRATATATTAKATTTRKPAATRTRRKVAAASK